MNDSFLQSIRDYRQYGRMDFWSPKEIEEYLHENGGVVGQDAACRAAALITYNHFEGRPSVNLFHGTTGCGKTFIWEQMKEYLGPRIVIVDGSTLTGEGWKGGNKLSSIFRHMRPDDRSKSIIVFDEFDKVLEPQYGASGTNYSDIVTNQLLCLCNHGKLFFGAEDRQESITVDCSLVSVVFLGCFDRLRRSIQHRSAGIGFNAFSRVEEKPEITLEDIIENGMRRELAGRITRVVQMDEPSVDDYIRIGNDEISRQEQLLNKKINCDPSVIIMLARMALGSELGARFMKNKLQSMIDDCIYEDPDAEQYDISYEHSTRLRHPEPEPPQFA